MCALFAGKRDISLIRKINRELLGNVITQQAAFYKFKIAETKTNIYGEASGEKYYMGPVLLNCLVERESQTYVDSENIMNIDFTWPINFKFFRDDMVEANVLAEVGDVILYENKYWEIDQIVENRYFGGKNPEYPNNSYNGPNPLNPNLENFGSSISIICSTHYIPADKVGITLERL